MSVKWVDPGNVLYFFGTICWNKHTSFNHTSALWLVKCIGLMVKDLRFRSGSPTPPLPLLPHPSPSPLCHAPPALPTKKIKNLNALACPLACSTALGLSSMFSLLIQFLPECPNTARHWCFCLTCHYAKSWFPLLRVHWFNFRGTSKFPEMHLVQACIPLFIMPFPYFGTYCIILFLYVGKSEFVRS